MKKCNIVTFHYAHNYGAVWQAYALCKYIQDMEADCKILDYIPPEEQKYCDTPYIATKGIKALVYNILAMLHANELKRGCEKFTEFRRCCLNCTERVGTKADIETVTSGVDIFITGSDQVWNCENGISQMYFLDFVKEGAVKSSYAASIGTNVVEKEYESDFFDKLKRFDYLSVREKTAQQYIQSNVNIEVHEHIDPVFLLKKDDWQKIEKKYEVHCKYILVFSLGKSPKIDEVVRVVKQQRGVKAIEVCISGVGTGGADKRLYDVGPSELLYLIRNAECIITNSFHITAMSVIFHKDFYAVPKNYTTRITDLLDKLGLDDRSILEETELVGDVKVTYEGVDAIIENERAMSYRYLRKVLS